MNVHSLFRSAFVSALGAAALIAGGCATTEGDTVQEKRSFVMETHDDTLQELYRQRPEAEEKIQNAPGYGVFSTIDTNLLLLATGGGYGVIVDNETGERTYMRMGEVGVGPGVGIKDLRLVLVFNDDDVMYDFKESGWRFGGSADATAQSGEQGRGAGVRGSAGEAIEIYQITESGVSLQATLRGTRFWRHDELNQRRYDREDRQYRDDRRDDSQYRDDDQYREEDQRQRDARRDQEPDDGQTDRDW